MRGTAWELARGAAKTAGVEVRPLESLEDAARIQEILRATWGDAQVVPQEMVRAFQGSGNVPYGAFDGDAMVGYVLGFLGFDPRVGVHAHSHMLAVLPDRRHAGVGYALKLAQRASALDHGINVARWTFDPLQARNAHLNFGKLGVRADRFQRNYYGAMQDTINRDDRSDRLEATWLLDEEPGGRPIPSELRPVLRATGPPGAPRPELRTPDVEDGPAGSFGIAVPRGYAKFKERDPGLASRWRDAVAEAFEACFAEGVELCAVAFDPGDETTGVGTYVLEPGRVTA